MKKITTILILALSSFFANAQDIQMMPSSMLSVYQLQAGQSFWSPGQEPMNTIVDRTQSFNAYEALRMNAKTQNMAKLMSLATAWYGFIEIKEAGVYVFSLQNNAKADNKTSVYINNKAYLVTEITGSSKTNSATKTLKLDPGFYKIDFVIAHTARKTPLNFYYPSNHSTVPSLSYWNKLSPANKTAITPATLMLKRK